VASGSPGKRNYVAPRREAQAAATRRSILEAAQRRFEHDGYVATSVEAIAEEAGVVRKTVYLAFGTKAGLLRGVWDLLLKGDTDEAPVAARPWYIEMLEEPDPARIVHLVAVNSCAVKQRIGRILAVIRDAAVIDDDAAALWRLIQTDFHENQRRIVEAVHARGGLRSDLDVDRATDVLWTLNHPGTWLLLVGERGWTADAFEAWFADAVRTQLLAPTHQPDRASSPSPRRRGTPRPGPAPRSS
jgi:AcrR family transcriptional regulator